MLISGVRPKEIPGVSLDGQHVRGGQSSQCEAGILWINLPMMCNAGFINNSPSRIEQHVFIAGWTCMDLTGNGGRAIRVGSLVVETSVRVGPSLELVLTRGLVSSDSHPAVVVGLQTHLPSSSNMNYNKRYLPSQAAPSF